MKPLTVIFLIILLPVLVGAAQTFDAAMKACVVSPGKDLNIVFQNNPSIINWAGTAIVQPSSTVEDYANRLNILGNEISSNCPSQPYAPGHPCSVYASSPTSLRVTYEQIMAYIANMPSYGCIPAQQAASNDQDNDGLTDSEESSLGTNPNLADSDFDGYSDYIEVKAGTDPKDYNSTPAGTLIAPQCAYDKTAAAITDAPSETYIVSELTKTAQYREEVGYGIFIDTLARIQLQIRGSACSANTFSQYHPCNVNPGGLSQLDLEIGLLINSLRSGCASPEGPEEKAESQIIGDELNLKCYSHNSIGNLDYTVDCSKISKDRLVEDLKADGLSNDEINSVIKSLVDSSKNLVTGSFARNIGGNDRFAPLILIIFIIAIAGLKIMFDRLLTRKKSKDASMKKRSKRKTKRRKKR